MTRDWATTRRRAVGALLAPALVVAMAANSYASANPAQLPAKYKSGLSMAMDTTYPPDEFIQNGKIVGFDADLGYAIGEVLGVKVTLHTVTFDDIITKVQEGTYDVGNSSFTDTPAREKKGGLDFIDYFKAGEGFYEGATSKAVFNGLKSLCGHSVAVETGTTEQIDAEAQAKSCHVSVLSYEDQNGANLAVLTGRAQVGFADSQVVAWIVHEHQGQFKLTGTPFKTAPYGFIVAKGSGLAQPLLAAVKALMADGKYKQILDKWGVEQGALSTPGINEATS
ncbi:MAG TPA: ABC transporter substrate-binding protein [Acidimicrobiales bacterium]|nr:ABC transporter substrate-binding protein [Acidimicrobiales bacterium]